MTSKNASSEQEKQGLIKTTIKTHISQAFTDMLNIYPIKDIELNAAAAYSDGSISVSTSPGYNGNRLFTVNAFYDINAEKAEAEIPDYKQGVIDLSSLLRTKAADDKTAGALIREYVDKVNENLEKNTFDAEKFNKQYRRYTETLIDSIEDVELKTDAYVAVGEDSVKCTEIRISLDGRELKSQLKSLSRLFMEDYGEEINNSLRNNSLMGSLPGLGNIDGMPAGIPEGLKQEDIDKAIDMIGDDVSGRLTLYVNNKADLIAVDARGSYKSTTVGTKIRWEKAPAGISGKIGLSLNQINAVNIGFELKMGSKGRNVHFTVTPDAFVDTFLGDYKGFSLEADIAKEDNVKTNTFKLLKSGEEFASISQSTTKEAFSGHLLEEGEKNIYPVESVTGSDYISIPDAIRFAIGVLDKIGEPELEAKIDEALSSRLNGLTVDSIRKMIEDGTLDKLIGPLGPGGSDNDDIWDDNGQYAGNNPENAFNMGNNDTGDNTGNTPWNDNGNITGNDPNDSNGENNTGNGPTGSNGENNTGNDPTGSNGENNTGNDPSGNNAENNTGNDPAGNNGNDNDPENAGGIGNTADYPTQRVKASTDFPKESEVFYYSYLELAGHTTPGRYKGRIFKMPEPKEVNADALEKEKQEYLKSLENVVLADQSAISVEMGDEVYLDIMPYLYGVAIEAYHFTDSYAKIGDNMYGEGLDEKIVGMKVGESKDITTKLGSQFGDFSGIEATFRVTVTEIERYLKPEWTEEFICGGMGFDSLDACTEMLMENLVEEADVSDDEILDAVKEEAISETTHREIPKELYDKLRNRYYNEVYDITEGFGLTPEQYYGGKGIETAELYRLMDEDIEYSLNDHCFYAAVAKAENITVTGKELADIINDYMEYYGYGTYEELVKNIRPEQIVDYEIETRIGRLILDNTVIEPYK